MYIFSNKQITIATPAQIPAITHLLNSAYRGETSRQGWTTEAHLIAGETRTDEANVQEVMEQQGSVFLVYNNEHQVTGCVNLQQHGNKLYLGMFGVVPKLQGAGTGKQLLQAAEEYARLVVYCNTIYMSVISVRSELIAWYERHGYKDTGERKFFKEDDLTGKHLQPLEFMILKKKIE